MLSLMVSWEVPSDNEPTGRLLVTLTVERNSHGLTVERWDAGCAGMDESFYLEEGTALALVQGREPDSVEIA